MHDAEPQSITRLLHGVRNGEAGMADSLLAIAYAELGSLARAHLSTERRGHTLQPTALVHEAWLKLAGHLAQIGDRQHFFAIASVAMRRVLTDHARMRNRQKRSDGGLLIVADESLAAPDAGGIDYVDLDGLLTHLANLNARHARVVELRVFGGLTIAEAAAVLDVSHATIETDWFTAKAWLRTKLSQIG